MPAIRNRANHRIYVARLGRSLEARESVELTPSQFDALRGHPLLEPVATEPAPKKATVKKEGDEQ